VHFFRGKASGKRDIPRNEKVGYSTEGGREKLTNDYGVLSAAGLSGRKPEYDRNQQQLTLEDCRSYD
jgi:hypothetical protein